jgi:glycogen debranching enzyme
MGKHFLVNDNLFYADNPRVARNTFLDAPLKTGPLPTYEESRGRLPRPVWDGHPDALACYDRTWEIAFKNLRNANREAGFVSDFIDTAFNGYLFMWDSSFIVMFGKYGSRVFDFQATLDNFYSHQHRDGFICREICEDQSGEQFTRDDPAATGPNILPWAEWEYFLQTGDRERLSRVFDPLCAFHEWFRLHRSWPDGSYFACGLSCGMDNQPRTPKGYNAAQHHGFMSWIDTCAQEYLSATILCKMAAVLGRTDETAALEEERALLSRTVNGTMWNDADAFYYDKLRDGTLSTVKTVGAYWTLLADLVPAERMDRFVAHLDNEKEFKRPVRVPSLSADHPQYDSDKGGYWCGAVWAPTDYMVLRALSDHGYDALAHEIGKNIHSAVVKVFNDTGTVWENYAPEKAAPGAAREDFVGWTGLLPISVLFEYVFGIRTDPIRNKITWNLTEPERHGVQRYPFGDAAVDLIAEAETEGAPRRVTVRSEKPVDVEVTCRGKKIEVEYI